MSEVDEAVILERQARMERISEESVDDFQDESRLSKKDLFTICYHARQISKIALDLSGSGQIIEKDIKVNRSGNHSP